MIPILSVRKTSTRRGKNPRQQEKLVLKSRNSDQFGFSVRGGENPAGVPQLAQNLEKSAGWAFGYRVSGGRQYFL
jgi:hypothetical protein